MNAAIWKQHLPCFPQHHWFEVFEENALEAVDALLLGRFDLANLAVEEPSVLLTTWVRTIANRGDFSTLLDSALCAWIEKNWAKTDRASIAMIRSVWDQLGTVVAATAPPAPNPCPLANAADALRARFRDHSGFATTLFAFRGRDAFHTCLNAVALNQRDDDLRTLWWRLIELPGGFPVRYAGVALNGIRCLHDPTGLFRYDVAFGVFAVGRVLTRIVRDSACDEIEAVEEFQYLFRRTRAHYPGFNQEWRNVFSDVASRRRPEDYLDGIWHFLELERQQLERQPRARTGESSRPFPTQRRQADMPFRLTWDAAEDWRRVVQKIDDRDPNAINDAEELLRKQRDHGRKTGNLSYYAKSLAKFADNIRDWDIGQAIRWAKELVEVEPYDPRPWSLLVNVLDPHRAWRLAWAVVDRFPLNGYARSGLAEVLKKQARFLDAEEVYRQAVEDFPRNVVMRGGLADVLKRQGRLGEAEEVYERAVGDFPDNPVCRNGLARVLALQAIATESVDSARLARARELYLAVANDPAFDRHNRCVALNGWAWVCERIGNLDEAEKFYRDVLRVDHHDSYAAHGLQRIARRRAGTSETDHFEAPSPVEEEMEESLPPRAWDETLPEDDARTADDTFAAGTAAVRAFQWHPTGYHLRLARAAFFRRAADRQENLPPRPGRFSPNTLRDAARKMLTEVLALRATDPRALAELASLDFQEGRKTGVFGQVLAQGMAEVLAVAANVARREAKRDDAKLTDAKALQSVLDAASGLRSLGPAGRPLADIAEGLGYLALQDGTARLVGAADAFEHLHLWIRPRAIQAEALAALETRAPTAGSPLTRVLDWSGRVATHFLERAGVDLRADSPVSPDAADRIDRRSAELVPLLEQASLDYAKEISPRIEELFEAADEG